MAPATVVQLTTTSYRHLHFGKVLGVDRLCAGTLTVFGPGFFVVRTGRHFVLVAIVGSLTHDGSKPVAPKAGIASAIYQKRCALE